MKQKKYLLIILTLAFATDALAQTQKVKARSRYFTATQSMSNAPTFGSKFVEGDILINLFDSSFYTCQKTGTFTQNWNKIGTLGSTGGGGGSNTYNYNISGNGLYISPDSCGAVHAATTFAAAGKNQTYIDSIYPGIGATTTDMIDWAAWQKAINIASATGLPVWCYGNYFVNKPITIAKTSLNIVVYGNNCLLTTTNNNRFAVFYRPTPTDNTEANTMVEAKYVFRNVNISGGPSQCGFDVGPGYGQWFEGCHLTGLAKGIWLKFGLNTMVQNCYALACDSGFIADYGNWPGASTSNSQSNHTKFYGCQIHTSDTAAVGFGVYAASGVQINSCIIEGDGIINGIDFDGKNATVVKDFTVTGTHFECASGATNAFIKLRMREGIATINTVFGQYPAVLVDAGSSSGDVFVHLENVVGWVANGSGKAINNAGGVNYILENNASILINKAGIPALFSGTAVSECTSAGCGLNKWYWKGLPSFQ